MSGVRHGDGDGGDVLDDTIDAFEREPFIAKFRIGNDTDMFFVLIHTKPYNNVTTWEIAELQKVGIVLPIERY